MPSLKCNTCAPNAFAKAGWKLMIYQGVSGDADGTRPRTGRRASVRTAFWNKTGTLRMGMLYVDNPGIAGLPGSVSV
jgi:hypothetical protein